MDNITKIFAFAGSLRHASYNRSLLRSAVELAPSGVQIEVFDLVGIPIFNQDFEKSSPPSVVEFKANIKAADAILIVTPEYNYSIPGVLKNAIDWASRPPGDNAFRGKPAAIMSASTGMLGGSRAQYHLRQTFVTLDVHPINKPEVIIALAEQKFDASGRLIDEKAKELIKMLLKNLVSWTAVINNPQNKS